MNKKEEIQRREILNVAHRDFHKGLNTYAAFKVSDRVIGEELVQDAFIKTWQYLVKKGKIGGMRAFLYHILNNLIVDEYRKRKYKSSSLDILIDKGFTPSVDESTRLFNTLNGKVVILLIPQLPVMYRRVVRMRYVEGLSLSEIARISGQTENAISVRLHRGILKLRVLYFPTASGS